MDLEQINNRYSEILGLAKEVNITLFNSKTIVHKLSHQHLQTKFWIVEGEFKVQDRIIISKLDKFPVPVLIADFMKAFKF